MEAVVNLKATPEEFRLIRSALQCLKAEEHAIVRDPDSEASEKRDARATIVRVDALLEKV